MQRTRAFLADLSESTADLETNERRDRFWDAIPALAAAAADDVREATGRSPYLEQATIYVDDPFYRQSAAAIVLEERFATSDELTVRIVCLVDHGIELSVLRSPTTAEFEPIAERVRRMT